MVRVFYVLIALGSVALAQLIHSNIPIECEHQPGKACVPKCCPEGNILLNDRKCHFRNHTIRIYLGEGATEPAHPDSYVFVYGDPCKNNKYNLEPGDEEDYNYILPNGSLMVPNSYLDALGPNDFCMETREEDGELITAAFVCFAEVNKAATSTLHFIVYPVGLLISVPFLLATIAVYLIIPDLRDLHGKALCCYASCLAVAYLFLACVQLGGTTFAEGTCVTLAYITQFSFVACFFWLNVMCIDVLWCVWEATNLNKRPNYPGLQLWKPAKGYGYMCDIPIAPTDADKAKARKVFIGYSLYAWLLPIILIVISMFIDFHPTIPSSFIKPSMGDTGCWFKSEEAALCYFYGPIATLLLINVVLFSITLCKVMTFNWNDYGQQRVPKQKARMCFILFFAMGISWVMEIVSWAIGGPLYAWVVADAFNILQGIVIFSIFVLEPRVKHKVDSELRDRLTVILSKYGCCRQSSTSSPDLPLPTTSTSEDNDTRVTLMNNSQEFSS